NRAIRSRRLRNNPLLLFPAPATPTLYPRDHLDRAHRARHKLTLCPALPHDHSVKTRQPTEDAYYITTPCALKRRAGEKLSGAGPRAGSTNCGRKARLKRVTFGFSTLGSTPCRKIRPRPAA